jgi:hypothetical protein
VSSETAGQEFTPNAFYERLVVLRDTDPKAFMRFSGATHAALQDYEVAKQEAEKGKKL